MATGPLLALLFAAVPQALPLAWAAGIAGIFDGGADRAALAPAVDVVEGIAAASSGKQVKQVKQARPAKHAGPSIAAVATSSAPALRVRAGAAVVLADEPVAAPVDLQLPRRAVWRSPAPPRGPPA